MSHSSSESAEKTAKGKCIKKKEVEESIIYDCVCGSSCGGGEVGVTLAPSISGMDNDTL